MSYDKIKILLNNLNLKYNGVNIKFKGLEKNSLRPEIGDNPVIDLVYEYHLDDVKKPFVVYPIIDDVIFPVVDRYLKYFKPEEEGGDTYRKRHYERFHGFRIVLDLIVDGSTNRIYQYGTFNHDFEIFIGTENEELFTKTYNGYIGTKGGYLEYTISYEPGRNGMYHMVDDSSLYLRPTVKISDITFTCDYSIEEPKLTEDLVDKINNVNEDIIVNDELPVTLLGFVSHDPLKIKMSELTKSFLEILFFWVIEEEQREMGMASPAHELVADTIYPILEGIDDSYCRPSMDSFKVDGKLVKPLQSYWPDSVNDAHTTFLTCLAVDYIKNEGIIEELRSEGLIN